MAAIEQPHRPTDPADPTTWKPGRSFWRVVGRPDGRYAQFADERFDCQVAAADGQPPLGLVSEDDMIVAGDPKPLPPGGGWHLSRPEAWLAAAAEAADAVRIAAVRQAAILAQARYACSTTVAVVWAVDSDGPSEEWERLWASAP